MKQTKTLAVIEDCKNILAAIVERNTVSHEQKKQQSETALWLAHQHNENGKPIRATLWMSQLIDLIADVRRHFVFVTGAAQVGKTLSYLLAMKRLCEQYEGVRVLLVYPTRGQRDTYPNRQLIPVFGDSIRKFGQDLRYLKSELILRYANTSKETTSNSGKSVAKASLTSFTADIAFLEEASQITTQISVIDRLNQSEFKSQPIRAIGTGGSGEGIEKLIQINKAKHVEFLQICPHCGSKNKGSTLLEFDKDVSGRPYNLHFSKCDNCGNSRNSGSWELDRSVITESCTDNVYVSLPPFIHCTSLDEYQDKLDKLTKRCLEESSIPNIYQQGLGLPFTHADNKINRNNIIRCDSPTGTVVQRFVGYDHGRQCSYYSIIDKYDDGSLHIGEIGLTDTWHFAEILRSLPPNSIVACDAYPDVKLVSELVVAANCPAFLAVQKNSATSDWDKKISVVKNGGIEYPALFFQYILWSQEFVSLVNNRKITFAKTSHELLENHLCSVTIADSKKLIRPDDHCDDLFFASIFAMLAMSVGAETNFSSTHNEQLWQW